jgi:hypothetical protein
LHLALELRAAKNRVQLNPRLSPDDYPSDADQKANQKFAVTTCRQKSSTYSFSCG